MTEKKADGSIPLQCFLSAANRSEYSCLYAQAFFRHHRLKVMVFDQWRLSTAFRDDLDHVQGLLIFVLIRFKNNFHFDLVFLNQERLFFSPLLRRMMTWSSGSFSSVPGIETVLSPAAIKTTLKITDFSNYTFGSVLSLFLTCSVFWIHSWYWCWGVNLQSCSDMTEFHCDIWKCCCGLLWLKLRVLSSTGVTVCLFCCTFSLRFF